MAVAQAIPAKSVPAGVRNQASSRGRQAAAAQPSTPFFPYVPAMLIAMLKDLLDLTVILALPGLAMVFDVLFSVVILILLWLFVPQHSFRPYRYLVLCGMVAVEGFFFGLNLLPGLTGSVIYIYFLEKDKGKSDYVLKA